MIDRLISKQRVEEGGGWGNKARGEINHGGN